MKREDVHTPLPCSRTEALHGSGDERSAFFVRANTPHCCFPPSQDLSIDLAESEGSRSSVDARCLHGRELQEKQSTTNDFHGAKADSWHTSPSDTPCEAWSKEGVTEQASHAECRRRKKRETNGEHERAKNEKTVAWTAGVLDALHVKERNPTSNMNSAGGYTNTRISPTSSSQMQTYAIAVNMDKREGESERKKSRNNRCKGAKSNACERTISPLMSSSSSRGVSASVLSLRSVPPSHDPSAREAIVATTMTWKWNRHFDTIHEDDERDDVLSDDLLCEGSVRSFLSNDSPNVLPSFASTTSTMHGSGIDRIRCKTTTTQDGEERKTGLLADGRSMGGKKNTTTREKRREKHIRRRHPMGTAISPVRGRARRASAMVSQDATVPQTSSCMAPLTHSPPAVKPSFVPPPSFSSSSVSCAARATPTVEASHAIPAMGEERAHDGPLWPCRPPRSCPSLDSMAGGLSPSFVALPWERAEEEREMGSTLSISPSPPQQVSSLSHSPEPRPVRWGSGRRGCTAPLPFLFRASPPLPDGAILSTEHTPCGPLHGPTPIPHAGVEIAEGTERAVRSLSSFPDGPPSWWKTLPSSLFPCPTTSSLGLSTETRRCGTALSSASSPCPDHPNGLRLSWRADSLCGPSPSLCHTGSMVAGEDSLSAVRALVPSLPLTSRSLVCKGRRVLRRAAHPSVVVSEETEKEQFPKDAAPRPTGSGGGHSVQKEEEEEEKEEVMPAHPVRPDTTSRLAASLLPSDPPASPVKASTTPALSLLFSAAAAVGTITRTRTWSTPSASQDPPPRPPSPSPPLPPDPSSSSFSRGHDHHRPRPPQTMPLTALFSLSSSWRHQMDLLAWEVCNGLQPHFPALLSALLDTAEEEAVQRRKEHQRHVADRSARRLENDADGNKGDGAVSQDAGWWPTAFAPHWEEGWISLRGCVDTINRVQQRWEEEQDKGARKAMAKMPIASRQGSPHASRTTTSPSPPHTERIQRPWDKNERRAAETDILPTSSKRVRMTLRLCEYITRRYGRPSFSVPPWMGEHGPHEMGDVIRLWPEPLREEEMYRVGQKCLSSTSTARSSSPSCCTPYDDRSSSFHGDDGKHFFFPDGNRTEWTPVLDVVTFMAAMGTALETFPEKREINE